MKSLQIVDGDLALGGSGSMLTLSGVDRVAQELECWLLEPLGTDKWHSKFGSRLDTYVGGQIDTVSLANIQTEVKRVVDNYVAYQKNQIAAYTTTDGITSAEAWTKEDTISSVDDISIASNGTVVTVSATVTLSSGATVTATQTV